MEMLVFWGGIFTIYTGGLSSESPCQKIGRSRKSLRIRPLGSGADRARTDDLLHAMQKTH